MMTLFKKILIANRGEIACRIAITCKRLGIKTVAVYSAIDKDTQHTKICDEAVFIGDAEPSKSYLRSDKIISAALATGAQAIHPGYGFLSENAAFAQACEKEGLVFIGPPAQAIEAMGSKSAAKTLLEKSGVPLVPGYHGEIQDTDFLAKQAEQIGYPILIKASAGGGGKGMRVVTRADEFHAALLSCQREAQNSFGDTHVLLEKYLAKPRHIEVQIFADQYGQFLYLFERDCSVQRRHQKVIEEAPAPGLSAEKREQMGQAAIAAAKAVAYVGAGTVEFIADGDDVFYFMEMNTRLQVEHPVTEMITGQDLVAWQIAIAAGQKLPLQQTQLSIHGHAIEARIYAENPEKDFLPATGKLTYMHTPDANSFAIYHGIGNLPIFLEEQSHLSLFKSSVRIDSGVGQNDVISPFYDPMIAKLIAWGQTRDQALQNMRQALNQFHVAGVKTNIDFLIRLMNCSDFVEAKLDTHLIERNSQQLLTAYPYTQAQQLIFLAGAVACLLVREQNIGHHSQSPWGKKDGWCIQGSYKRILHFLYQEHAWPVDLIYADEKIFIQITEKIYQLSYIHNENNYRLLLKPVQHIDRLTQGDGGQDINEETGTFCASQFELNIFPQQNDFYIYAIDQRIVLRYLDPLDIEKQDDHSNHCLTAPMPGKIIAIHAQNGQSVSKGMPLLVMEAMKMEHTIIAPIDGVIELIHYSEGEQVAEGAQLLSLMTDEAEE